MKQPRNRPDWNDHARRLWAKRATILLCCLLIPAGVRVLHAQVTVTISPSVLTLATLGTQPFTATVSGTSNPAVTWQVNGISGGNANLGVISTTIPGTVSEALYLAPKTVPQPAALSVTAISQADPSKSASATVTIQVPSRSGVTYFVSTTGSDSNAGTSQSPWRHIDYAATKVNAGDTVEVMGGVYNEAVNIRNSGDATSGHITFMSYPGQTAIVDGTGLKVGNGGQSGLFNLVGSHSYIVIQGFEIRNFQSSKKGEVPIGIDFEGSGTQIQILNNHIHDIVQTRKTCNSANALGVAIYGNQAPDPIGNLTFVGNEVDHNITGCSENVSLDGNVQYFVEAANTVHDGNNIAIVNIGFEKVSPNANDDQARDGWVFQNTIYNITSTKNPVYHNQPGADGYYCDGCTRVVVERNLIHDVDINEMTSEHHKHVGSYVVFRNNVVYNSLYAGVSIGGYSSGVGGSDHCTVVNNTLWNNGTYKGGVGEFQIQFHATNNAFYNNIAYGTQSGYLLYDFTKSSPNPALLDANDYFNLAGGDNSQWNWQHKSITGFAKYQAASGQDASSFFDDPQFVDISQSPPNLDIAPSSPVRNRGINFGPDVVGLTDFAGNPRVGDDGKINMGAFQQ